ncbi:hypothetical protein ACJX0J_023892 [Zea mays]
MTAHVKYYAGHAVSSLLVGIRCLAYEKHMEAYPPVAAWSAILAHIDEIRKLKRHVDEAYGLSESEVRMQSGHWKQLKHFGRLELDEQVGLLVKAFLEADKISALASFLVKASKEDSPVSNLNVLKAGHMEFQRILIMLDDGEKRDSLWLKARSSTQAI